MLSSIEDIQAGNLRYYAAYHGRVEDADDPEGLHRARITIPGLVEPSNWAFPITAGGGSAQRGGHVAPLKGADVVVWFLGGDLERPIYAGGWWGKPDDGGEMPTDVKEFEGAPAEAAKVQSLEFERLKITVDERDGKRALSIQNKVSGDFITLDLENHGLHVRMSTAVLIEVLGVFDVKAAQITLNDRLVLSDSKAIG
jgi:hypothetical protein